MKNIINIFIITVMFISCQANTQGLHHNIQAKVNPKTHYIQVTDEVHITADMIGDRDKVFFKLNKHLNMEKTSVPCKKMEADTLKNFTRYYFKPTTSNKEMVLILEYKGVIFDDFEKGAAEYARGFTETSGIISEKGIYLASSSHWLPQFDEPLFSYDMSVTLPEGWDLMSQGVRSREKDSRTVKYACKTPQEEAYLIAAKFNIYEDKTHDVLLQAFLRTPDKELADKYLKMTATYMKMYEDMLGPYPYTKFALVENFWQTGYGMPSFTLLGDKIIRFPFIIYSSYPHEMLHNYWGNSVYVDFEKGNWCEGITAYMADHMLKEQRGQGADYRRNTLQKYTDFVNEENDFPLNKFLNRNNAAEEAIGYGKCLMMNHMLRKEVGDEMFLKAYQKFYKDNKFMRASWTDIAQAFNQTTGKNYKSFFNLWVNTKGAPHLQLSGVRKQVNTNIYEVFFTLQQTQKGEFFPINIPVAFYFEDTVFIKKFAMDKPKQEFYFQTDKEPLRIEIDPQFDIFRSLDKAEVPPTLSQVFGEKSGMIILPFESKNKEGYQQLAETWQASQKAQGKVLEIVFDKDLESLPKEGSVWVVGFENKFYGLFDKVDLKAQLGGKMQDAETAKKKGSWVMVMKNPANADYTMGFVGTQVQEAISGLARLLPHYGKYSYLGFKGSRPDNFLKGNFKASYSPLHYTFPNNKKQVGPKVHLETAKALIDSH